MMTNIFVSRPTWVDKPFREGLASFLRLLGKMKLEPRTLGAGNDYPNKSPLDEVIAIMQECGGAIILGYPQVEATTGKLKDKDLKEPLLLATEWNHIEAGLAYARGLPLLTIHHQGVKRGVFDRGAVNAFIYELDLTNPGWPLGEQISGALEKWVTKVVKNPQRRAAPADETSVRKPISKEMISILQIIASSELCDLQTVSEHLKVTDQKAAYFIEKLAQEGLIAIDGSFEVMSILRLTHEGRAALFERDLL